jgi:hypothetical protein
MRKDGRTDGRTDGQAGRQAAEINSHFSQFSESSKNGHDRLSVSTAA